MAVYTSAYSDFLHRRAEISRLIYLARKAKSRLPFKRDPLLPANICRAGVVLLCSHVEGYMEDLAEIALDRIGTQRVAKTKLASEFKYFFSKDIIKSIKEAKDPKVLAALTEELITRDIWIWDSQPNFIGPLNVDLFLSDFANPKFKRIRKLWSRFGYVDYHKDLQQRLSGNYSICINMLDQVVDQRNKIAHGDNITTSNADDLFSMVSLVSRFCRMNDLVIGNWFSQIGCKMR